MSETNGKIKVYKNLNRNDNTDYKPYIPQYQVHGIQPNEHHGASSPNMQMANPSPHNPREGKRQSLRQPYAEITKSPIGKGPVPNVGNNMEHTWSSVDGEVVDDLTGETVGIAEMIDNNEFVTDQAFGFQSGISAGDIQPNNQGKVLIEAEPTYDDLDKLSPNNNYPSSDDTEALMPIVANLADDSFLLIVAGVPVASQ